MRPFRPVALFALGALALPGFTAVGAGTAGLGDLADVCAVGTTRAAATALLGAGAEVVDADDTTALVLTPGVYPGVRNRLVHAGGDVWCPASAVNLTAGGATADAVALATAAATTLPAAFFDGVTVTDAAEVAPGHVTLTTHARSNGVVAEWDVTVDAAGIREATWTATGFAVAPFDAQIEGLTALPGATWSYERNAAGLVESTTTIEEIAARNEEADPSPTMSVTTPDDFTVHIFETDAVFPPAIVDISPVYVGVAPDAGQDTGITQADYLRIMKEGAERNHEDFHAWGLEPGWVDDEGAIYVDGALSAYCLACVLVSEHYNVHMSRGITAALDALGYSYPDERLALIDIVGHEIVHNYQNAYGKPSSVRGARHNSYSEGTARFSETLHDYSHVSHQPGSLVFANDTNGCNGWQGNDDDAAFAAGPLTGQSYDACYFWLTFYGQHGIDGFVSLFEHSVDLESGTPWTIYDSMIETATGVPLTETLANFAAQSLTLRGYTWAPPAHPGADALNWAAHLDRWTPSGTIGRGDTVARSLRDGGMAAFEVLTSGTVQVSEGAGQAVALVTDDGSSTRTVMLADGDRVDLPSGTTGWLVLINASTANAEVSATLS